MAEREKRAFKFNIIDIILTVVIAGVVAVGSIMLVNAFGVDTSTDKEQVVFEYTIEFKGILDELKDNVSVGDIIIDGQKRYNIGKVSKVVYSPYMIDVFDKEKGEMIATPYPDNVTLKITVKKDGYILDDNYYLEESSMRLAVGYGISVHAPHLCSYGYISEINVYPKEK